MKKSRLILIILSVLILLGCIGMTVCLLFFNYQNVRLFKQAQNNFRQGDEASLSLAESQLLQVVRKDGDNEAAFVMLGEIARRRKIYPEQVYYCYMAFRLNPLSSENKERYIESLCYARYFDRLETFLQQESSLNDKYHQLLLYVAGCNGNINKHNTQLARRDNDNRFGELALLLFKHKHLSNQDKLRALDRIKIDDNDFLKQEVHVARAEIYFAMNNFDGTEQSLLQSYKLNEYAFAPLLGRFYANYRNIGKALEIFEKHLSVYHDQTIAMQCAEIYCLLNKADKIAGLKNDYQSDSGNRAMLCSFYFDALIAFCKKDMAALKDGVVPLRKNINTPLSAFMFFCVDIHNDDLNAIRESYNILLAHPNYLNLQEQADNILLEYLKKSFMQEKKQEKIIALAEQLYKRKKDVFLAKLILLAQKRSRSINPLLLSEAVKSFAHDHGVLKFAIEYYLTKELAEAGRLIELYKQKFPSKIGDMLYYEIILNMRKKDFRKVSELFRKNFSPELLPEYWNFASATKSESDLLFLSKDKLYEPYCKALILLKKGKNKQACDILEHAEAGNNHTLQFFAAKTLAENSRNQAALAKYEKIADSEFKLAVLLNMSEIYAETGNLEKALSFSKQAYVTEPQMQETQLCYADKLYKKGKFSEIPDVIKLSSRSSLYRRMKPLWVAGMQQRIKECNINTQQEKIRELCRQLLVVAPDNNTALEYLKRIQQMRQ